MPFALLFIGLVLVVTGARDTYRPLGAQLVSDFTGPGNFTYWLVAIGAVGAVGYYSPAQTFSRAFLALIMLAMVLKNGGIFDKFVEAIKHGPAASPSPDPISTASPATGGTQVAGKSDIDAGQIAAMGLKIGASAATGVPFFAV